MKQFLSVVLILASYFAFSQTGEVSGVILDKEYNNEPLPFADVYLKGTTKGVTTDIDGKFSLPGLKVGVQTIVIAFVGYETKEVQVTIKAGQTTKITESLSASADVLEATVIVAKKVKEDEGALLDEQKKAVTITQAIGAKELEKKAVSDAAAATLKVTGINKKEGSSKIYVRGLGDRYNSTTLNGLPVPSNDPRNKNVDLSLFGTGIIQNVGISKAFTSELSLDVSGANVNIVSKEISGKSIFKIGVSSGLNTVTTLKDFKRIDGANWIGIANDLKHDIVDLRFYDFKNGYSPETIKAAPTFGLSLNYGRQFTLSSESNISIFLVGSFGNKFGIQEGFNNNVRDIDNIGSKFDTETFKYTSSKIGLANVEYKINSDHKIKLNSLVIQSNEQKVQDFIGTTTDIGRGDEDNRRVNLILQTQIQNLLNVNQLLSSHKIGESIDINSAFGYSTISNDEPDRRKNTFIINDDTNQTRFSQNAVRDNSRFYGNLFEKDLSGYLKATKYFGERFDDDNKGKITLGYNGRHTDRQFDGIYFDHDIARARATFIDTNNVDSFFNQENLDNNLFSIETSRGSNGFDAETYLPQLYDAEKTVHAGFIDIVYKFNDQLTANLGIRAEDIKMNVTWNTNVPFLNFSSDSGIKLDKQYALPSLNLNYKLNDRINLRAAGSLTYTYPQFKEIAPFTYEGINFQESGNPNLIPSDNYNAEVKFEFFPEENEILSVGFFGKLIQNSINRLERNSAVERDLTFDNSGDATVFGSEIEAKFNVFKKDIDDETNQSITAGGNLTLMQTKLKFNKNNTFFNYTGTSTNLEGASPLTLNANITYSFNKDNKATTSSLVLNYQSDKVFSIGTNFQQNIKERGVPLLDFVFSHKFNKNLSAKLNAKNLLNPRFITYRDLDSVFENKLFESVPDEIIMSSYRKGSSISVGLSYSL